MLVALTLISHAHLKGFTFIAAIIEFLIMQFVLHVPSRDKMANQHRIYERNMSDDE